MQACPYSNRYGFLAPTPKTQGIKRLPAEPYPQWGTSVILRQGGKLLKETSRPEIAFRMLRIAQQGNEHEAMASMLRESLPEMYAMAALAVTSRKPNQGCYGYPALLLLLGIADTIGTYVCGGSVEKHLGILNDPAYYGFGLGPADLKAVAQEYRGLLTHNAVLGFNHAIAIGAPGEKVYEIAQIDGMPLRLIRLIPFVAATEQAVEAFLAQDLDALVQASGPFKDAMRRASKK